ncbi:pyochelin biosynthetic protein PchC [Saccharopolyspora spinosa]|uniref:Pyochelin biosynthetic protein PchC n=2 Tax=Saccharopolyspora spinosa TaxID=60894 RepID=A0A2N3Y0M5_SACSN|nr:pyochelin biosynthetic protein PchC [Saccharopolyspora spinosa]
MTMSSRLGPWLRRYAPRPAAAVRLVCMPHAGGGAGAYRAWAALLPPSVELVAVQYPGREDRFTEPLAESMDELVEGIAGAVRRIADRPYLVFGHSMGATVAYETVQRLRRLNVVEPDWLLVSGRPAPHQAEPGDVHLRDDDGLCAELVRLGGTDTDVLSDPDLRAVVLGYVRGDYRVIETYRPRPEPKLTCPIGVFVGDTDPELDVAGAQGWRSMTAGRTDVESFEGNHFYLGPRRREVIAAILRRLDPAVARTGPEWTDMP